MTAPIYIRSTREVDPTDRNADMLRALAARQQAEDRRDWAADRIAGALADGTPLAELDYAMRLYRERRQAALDADAAYDAACAEMDARYAAARAAREQVPA